MKPDRLTWTIVAILAFAPTSPRSEPAFEITKPAEATSEPQGSEPLGSDPLEASSEPAGPQPGAPGTAATPEYLLDEPGLVEITPEAWQAQPGVFDFLPGERLDYDVRYLGVPIGQVWLEVARFIERDGVRMAHLTAGAKTNGFWSRLYRVDDVSEAWVDLDRGRTIRTRTHTHHGRRREVFEQVDFDWQTHFVRVREERRHRDRLIEVAFDFGPFVHDTFDLFYAVRSLPLEPGFSVQLPVYANRKIYAFQVEVVGRETWQDPLFGSGEAVVLKPYDLLDGEPTGNGAGEVWVRSDRRHVPVRILGWFITTERFRVGGIRADLVSHRARLPGWPEPPGLSFRPNATTRRTEDGRPIWKPPAAIRQARKQSRTRPFERRSRLSKDDADSSDRR